MLEIRHLKVGKASVLYEVNNIQLLPGRLYTLIGANGAGKSTLLDAIAYEILADDTVFLNQYSLSKLTMQKRSLLISLVESRFQASEYLSTQEYLDLGRFPHTGFHGRLSIEDKAVVNRISEQLQLSHLIQQSTLTLSDGERQRVSIARALIQETPVMLLDEPTSFLDYPNKRAIMQLLKSIAQAQQKIVLLASHDLELCLEYADECLVINPTTKQLEMHDTQQISLNELVTHAFSF